MKNRSDIVEYAPMVKNKAARVLIWVGVVFFICFAVGTKNLALIILAVLSPGIAGIFTAKGIVKKKPEK